MEITTKKLHHHALPIALMIFGIFGLAVAVQAHYSNLGTSPLSDISRALTTRAVHIRPAKNGLAEISQPSAGQPKTNLGNLNQAGRSAEVTLFMQ